MSTHKKYFIYNNYISELECFELSEWILDKNNFDYFKSSNHPGTIRRTTRYSLTKQMNYPSVAYKIQNKIKLNLKELFRTDVKIRPDFFDGMYASYGIAGDECQSHTDAVVIEKHVTYHFNVILSDHVGGDVVFDNKIIKLNKTDGILYPVSEVLHSTTELIGDKPRMFWCFGFCIPIEIL